MMEAEEAFARDYEEHPGDRRSSFGITTEGRITDADEIARELTGYDRKDLVGKRFSSLFVLADRKPVEHLFRKLLMMIGPRTMQATLVRKDGARVPVELTGDRVTEDTTCSLRITVEETSHRTQLDEELARIRQDMSVLTDITAEVSSELEREQLMSKVAKRAATLLGGDAGAIAEHHPEEHTITYPYLHNLPDDLQGVVVSDRQGVAGYVIGAQCPVAIEDYPSYELAIPNFVQAGVKSVASAPLISKGRAIGAVGVFTFTPRAFSKRDVDLLELVAKQATVAIENARLYEDATAEARRLAAVNSISKLLNSTLQTHEVLNLATAELCRALGSAAACTFFYYPETHEISAPMACGVFLGREEMAVTKASEYPVLEEALKNNQAIVTDLVEMPHGKVMKEQLGVNTALLLPLIAKDRPIGGIIVARRGAPYSQKEINFSTSIAGQAAIAVENARLYQSVEQSQRKTRLLLDATQTILSLLDQKTMLNRFVTIASHVVGVSRASIVLFHTRAGVAELAAIHGPAAESAGIKWSFTTEEAFYREAARGSPVLLDINDPKLDDRPRRILKHMRIERALIAPIKVARRTIGVLALDEPGIKYNFSREDQSLASAVAGNAAVALENARLYRETKEAVDRRATALEIGRLLTSTLEFSEVFSLTLEELCKALGGKAGAYLSYDYKAGVLRGELGYRMPNDVVKAIQSPITRYRRLRDVASRGGAYYVFKETAVPEVRPYMEQFGLEVVLTIPLTYKDQLVGVALVGRPERKPFSQDEMDFGLVVARQAAIAIKTARLFERERVAKKEADLLNAVGLALSSVRSWEEVYPKIARGVLHLIGCDAVGITETVDIAAFRFAYVRNLPEKLKERIFTPDGSGEIWEAVGKGRSVLINNYPNQSWAYKELVDSGVKAIAIAPMIVKNRIIGALTAVSLTNARAFEERCLELLTSLSRQAALAIENTRLYLAQFDIADKLQKSLFPRELPKLDWMDVGVEYQSATTEAIVGGDFYDFIELKDGRLVFFLGDVAGKGIERASLASMARSSLRIFASLNPDPTFVLGHTNGIIAMHSEPSDFVSTFYAVFDPEKHLLTCGNAGHPPPIALMDGTAEFLPFGQPVLGVSTDIAFSSITIDCRKLQTFVLYTDGVTEARAGRDFFGEDRLLKTVVASVSLDAQGIAAQVMEAAKTFAQNRLFDDVAIVVLKCRCR
ncbi:MAG: GAF domain-containing protein [Candidatus Aquicultorales bacterium]